MSSLQDSKRLQYTRWASLFHPGGPEFRVFSKKPLRLALGPSLHKLQHHGIILPNSTTSTCVVQTRCPAPCNNWGSHKSVYGGNLPYPGLHTSNDCRLLFNVLVKSPFPWLWGSTSVETQTRGYVTGINTTSNPLPPCQKFRFLPITYTVRHVQATCLCPHTTYRWSPLCWHFPPWSLILEFRD